MGREHCYRLTTRWTGNLGSGTSGYGDYSRNHEIVAAEKAMAIPGSSDPAFRGEAGRYNPEDLLVASLSACHMLWLLHLAADAGIVVTAYEDEATGTMEETAGGGGAFTEVTLRPQVTIASSGRAGDLEALHHRAHLLCFIARSVNFPVKIEPSVGRPFADEADLPGTGGT